MPGATGAPKSATFGVALSLVVAGALTFDEFSKNASGEAALEKILQDRAEAARQKLSGDGTTPPAAPTP